MAEDIERYLDGYPILARPPRTSYKVRKFVARHKLPVALATTLTIALIAFASVATWQATQIAAQRNRAVREARIATQINGVLQNILTAPDPWEFGRKDTTVLETLRGAAERIDAELADAPLVAAAVNLTLGQTYRSFGAYAEAENRYRLALEHRRAALAETDPLVAEGRNALAELLYLRGDFDSAERLMREALDVFEHDPDANRSNRALALNNLALVRARLGDRDEARRFCREALALRDAIVQAADRDASLTPRGLKQIHNDRAQTRNNLAGLLRAGGSAPREDLEEARDLYAAALTERRKWLGEDHPDVAKMHNNYGLVSQDLGDFTEAGEHLNASLRTLRAGLGDEHPFIARALNNLAKLHLAQGDFATAEVHARAALSMRERLGGISADEIAASRTLLNEIRQRRTDASPE